jgi:hypothetical protein
VPLKDIKAETIRAGRARREFDMVMAWSVDRAS